MRWKNTNPNSNMVMVLFKALGVEMNFAHYAQTFCLCNIRVHMLAHFTSGLGGGQNEVVKVGGLHSAIVSEFLSPFYYE